MYVFIPNSLIRSEEINYNFNLLNSGLNECPYKFRAYRSGSVQGISVGGGNLIFNTENFDINGDYDETTGIYTAPVDGYYSFASYVRILLDDNEYASMQIRVNGSIRSHGGQVYYDPVDTTARYFHIGVVDPCVELDAGDEVQIYYYTDDGENIEIGEYNSWISGHLMSAKS